MVNDYAVGGEQIFTCALIETSRWIAVFLRAGGALGVDDIPDIWERCGRKFLYDAVLAGGRPFGETDEFGPAFVCEQFGLFGRLRVFNRVAQASGAAVIAFADHQCGLERGVAFELRDGIE